MINAADFLKWLCVFNVPYGGGQPGSVTQREVQISAFNYSAATGVNDAFVATLYPVVNNFTDGLLVTFNSLTLHNLTATPTLQVNSLPAKLITLWGGAPLLPDDIQQDTVYIFLYNLTDDRFELINPSVSSADTSSVQGNLYNSNVDIGAADAYVVNLIPAYPNTIYPDNFPVYFKASNTNTGNSTLTTNGNTYPIALSNGSPLPANSIIAGELYWCLFDNAQQYWVLMNPTPITNGGLTWVEVTSTTQTLQPNYGYIAASDNVNPLVFTLPTTSALGANYSIIGKGAGGWQIAQNAGQNIQIGSTSTTVGVTGSISSTNQFDSLTLVCTTANTTFTGLNGSQGNITIN